MAKSKLAGQPKVEEKPKPSETKPKTRKSSKTEKVVKGKETKPSVVKEQPKQVLEKKMTIKDQYIEKAKKLGPEPSDGIRIGFTFHDGKRLIRKFNPKSKGNDLKVFIAACDQMFDKDGNPLGFTLQQNLGPKLELDQSLQKQGISKSVMFSVVLDD